MADTNELIHKANQMGLIDTKLQTYYYNASNCVTKAAVLETNIKQSGGIRVLRIENISGMLLILPIGLGGALLVFLAEHIHSVPLIRASDIRLFLLFGQNIAARNSLLCIKIFLI